MAQFGGNEAASDENDRCVLNWMEQIIQLMSTLGHWQTFCDVCVIRLTVSIRLHGLILRNQIMGRNRNHASTRAINVRNKEERN